MLIEIIIISMISLCILKFRKRKFSFKDINIKGYQVFLYAAIIEISAEFLYKTYSDSYILKILSLHWLLYLALIFVTLINIKNTYMKFFFLGTLLNFTAILFNDFKMPVFVSSVLTNTEVKKIFLSSGQDLVHSLLTESTRLKILCDIITLPQPYPFPKTISIGDVLLLVGIFTFWQDKGYLQNK